MNWKPALNGNLPKDNQEIKIKVDGIIHNAVYNEGEQSFNVIDSKNLSFPLRFKLIYWMEVDK